MDKILFIGDSITDCDHLFEHYPIGNGYIYFISKFLSKNGYKTTVKNMGQNGFTISRLVHMLPSYLSENADTITILIGINDIGIMMNTNRTISQQNDLMLEFSKKYRQLITSLLPCTKHIILMEVFSFPYPAEYRTWFPLIKKMNNEIRELSNEFQCSYVSLHDYFNEEALKYGYIELTTDGIHLTSFGHQLLAQRLIAYLFLQ